MPSHAVRDPQGGQYDASTPSFPEGAPQAVPPPYHEQPPMQQPNNSPLSGRKKALLCACNYFGTSNQLGGEITCGGARPCAGCQMCCNVGPAG